MLARRFTFQFIGLLICMGLTINAQGQVEQPLEKISLDFKKATLQQVLDEISNQIGASFSYNSKKIPLQKQVTIRIENKTINETLGILFENMEVDYEIIEGKIILKKSKKTQFQNNYTISGHIRDKNDGETLIGATILIDQLSRGSISNAYGFYSITIPTGSYVIRYSYVGYDDIIKEVVLDRNTSLDISLEQNISQLEEVLITPGDSATRIENIHANAFSIDNASVVKKTAALGESDVIKSLDVIPGIQLFRDGSTFFNVRGGDRDQNQILVDEAPIYNPAHFLGLFSSIMPESVKDMKLYKGDLPARMGGRLSSVLDIKTRDGNLKKVSANGSLGLISGRFAIEGPIKKDKSSFFVSGRKSYIQGLLKSLDSDLNSLFFSDFNAKTNIQINKKNRLYLSTFIGNDEFISDGGIKWGNRAGTIRWNHIHSDKLFSNTTIYTSKYEYSLLSSSNLTWKNHISNISLKSDFTLYRDINKTLNFGYKLSFHNFNPGNAEDSLGRIPPGRPFVPKRNTSELSLYMSKDRKVNDKLLVTYGFRLSTWNNFGRTIEYEIDDDFIVVDSTVYDTRKSYNDYSNLEPRFSLTYLPDTKNLLKFNYSRSAQYLNLISNSISPFNNLEVWLPASVNIKPQIANQLSIGWFKTGEHFSLSIEGYHKSMKNQIDYVNQAKLLLNPHLEAELRTGTGTAYGIEAMLTKNTGKLTGWLSYTFSRSLRKIEGINNGESYPSLWDKPHQFSINANYTSSKRTNWSATLYLSSGAPITTPTSFYQFSGRVVPIYGSKNNDRLPTYNRFDISFNHQLNKHNKNFNHFLTISLFNLYGRQNGVLENFNKVEDTNGDFIVPTDINSLNQVVSTKIFVFSIVPSITYSFKI